MNNEDLLAYVYAVNSVKLTLSGTHVGYTNEERLRKILNKEKTMVGDTYKVPMPEKGLYLCKDSYSYFFSTYPSIFTDRMNIQPLFNRVSSLTQTLTARINKDIEIPEEGLKLTEKNISKVFQI